MNNLPVTALGPDDPDDGDAGRRQRGKVIAERARIVKTGAGYKVPSQSTNRFYHVLMVANEAVCGCPDFEARGLFCKHIYSVKYHLRTDSAPANVLVEAKPDRPTYGQNWSAYNKAQIHEGEIFARLLRELCDTIVQPPQKMGRPRLPMSDMIYAIATKVYRTFSGRRVMSDIRNALSSGQLDVAPAHTSISHYLGKPELTPLLEALIQRSAIPLVGIEDHFSPDSSGFSTKTYVRWYDTKWGRERKKIRWLKAHIASGAVTNVVAAAQVTDDDAHDTNFFEWLVNTTAKTFDVKEISADKAYLSRKNLHIVDAIGAVPYIQFKKNSMARPIRGTRDALWEKMFHLYAYNREEFNAHYHRRSNVESTFSMVKGKFGTAVRSKNATAQINETLSKILCHNIVVLVQSMYALDVVPEFEDELRVAA